MIQISFLRTSLAFCISSKKRECLACLDDLSEETQRVMTSLCML